MIIIVVIVAAIVIAAIAGYIFMTSTGKPKPSSPTTSKTTLPATTSSSPPPAQTTTTTTETAGTMTQTGPAELNLKEIRKFEDMLNIAKAMTYRFEDSNGSYVNIGYEVLGTEEVDGTACWKIRITTESSDGEPESYTIWVSQQDYLTLQLELSDGTIVKGPMIAGLWPALLASIMWPFQWVWSAPRALWQQYYHGGLVYLGTEVVTYGETTLTVYKYKWVPPPSAPREIEFIEVWIAELPNGYGIVTKFHVQNVDGSWGEYRLISIKLA